MSSSLKKDIIAILSEELDIYKAILRETYQQIDMIKKMDIDGLQIILHEKDKCINKIETIEKKIGIELRHVFQDFANDRDILSYLRNIEKTIQDIIKIEEMCCTELSRLQAGISEEILLADKKIHASKAYSTSNPSPPRFFDTRS